MNYRHIFHAGGFADVFKHSILTWLLSYLCKKDKPCCYIDTHAGIGIYDLRSITAQKTKEYQQGIQKLFNAQNTITELTDYLTIVKKIQPFNDLVYYPGSPVFASNLLRPMDQLILNELHPEDFATLVSTMGKGPTIHYHKRDAYEFLPAILPPQTRRGLILIDPPYEQSDEFTAIVNVIKKSFKRFSQGIYMIWYPIVSQRYQTFVKQMIKDNVTSLLVAELVLQKIYFAKTELAGCGVMIINPPWNCDKAVKKIAGYLWQLFSGDKEEGFYRVELFGEDQRNS